MKAKFFSFSLLFVALNFFIGCSTAYNWKGTQIKSGDLLFVGTTSSDLSQAINQVTQTEKKDNFSHIALVEISNKQAWVLHAAPKNGSERISLEVFLEEANQSQSDVVLYRIKKEYKIHPRTAIAKAKEMLGKPYNFTYVLSDSAYYCSDFVYHAFENDSIFQLEPMTFKEKNSDKFHPTWITFYEKLNMEIPEGKLGCNPNGMAKSDKLERIGVIH